MIDLQADALREEYALRLGLPADSDPVDVMLAVMRMTNEDIALSELQGFARDMGGQLRVDLVCIDDLVDEWHDGAGEGQELHEFLGLPWGAYKAWVEGRPAWCMVP